MPVLRLGGVDKFRNATVALCKRVATRGRSKMDLLQSEATLPGPGIGQLLRRWSKSRAAVEFVNSLASGAPRGRLFARHARQYRPGKS